MPRSRSRRRGFGRWTRKKGQAAVPPAIHTKRGAAASTAVGFCDGNSLAAADCRTRQVCFTYPLRGAVTSHCDS